MARPYYSITIKKFRPDPRLLAQWRRDAKKNNRPDLAESADCFEKCDAMWDDSCWLGEVGGGGGAIESKDIVPRVREKLKTWLRYKHYTDRDEDGNWKQRAKLVPLPAITRKTLYFRCDFPEILKVDGVFRMLAELKGAKADKTGGLWA